MKVRELIQQLEHFDSELEVFVSDEPQFCLDGVPELRGIGLCRDLNEKDAFPDEAYSKNTLLSAVVIDLSYSEIDKSRIIQVHSGNN